jgi:serine/threonine protein kinase
MGEVWKARDPDGADRKGPIALDEALGIAKQIGDALEAAHEKGIVHRDLMPANIKIRPDGSVKVLDFGLAKSGESQEVTPDSPTMMSPTRSGMILGTAGYMSPEQARGQAVDKRADTLEVGQVQKLFDGIIATTADVYDVSADGQKFVIMENAASVTPHPLTLLQNWTAALRK